MHKLADQSIIPQSGSPLFQTDNLCFRYPCHSIVLRGITLQINKGDRLAIVGANGSGKSTLLRHLSGIFQSDGNPVKYKGKPLENHRLQKARPEIGILFQDPDDHLFCTTVFEDIAFGPMNQGLDQNEVAERVNKSLTAVGLLTAKDKAPHHLSYGQKKRVALAAIMAMDPETLILDEPTANIDPEQIKIITQMIQRFRGTLICVSHDLFFLEKICTRAVVLQRGEIHHDYTMEDLMDTPKALREHGLDFSFKIPSHQETTPKKKTDPKKRVVPSTDQTDNILTLQNYSFAYKDGTSALHKINLEIKAGERLALVGENGAGKSTLALCLSGILSGSGEYLFESLEIDPKNSKNLWQKIGIIFQDSADQLFSPSCWDEVAFGLKQQKLNGAEINTRVQEALATVNLTGYEKRSPLDMSSGERKRLAIASVICMHPKVLIMDEPTAGLDLQGEALFMAAIKKLPMTQILISHNPFLIKNHCQRVIVLHDGAIINDSNPYV